jgi:hypothetical protein
LWIPKNPKLLSFFEKGLQSVSARKYRQKCGKSRNCRLIGVKSRHFRRN